MDADGVKRRGPRPNGATSVLGLLEKEPLTWKPQSRLVVEGSRAFPDLPQLLTGDFNADAANPAVATLKDGGWIDTYAAVHGPDDPGFTYHGFVGSKFTPRAGTGKIDFIFVRGNVRPLAAEVLRNDRDGRYPSDHYFISAEISLEPPAKAV